MGNIYFFSKKNTGGQSFFSRKDSIRTIYTSLHNELKKVVATGRNALGGTAPHLEELLSHLSEQLCYFVQARMEIADFYEKMYSLSTQKFINSEELVNFLESILKKYSSRSVCPFNVIDVFPLSRRIENLHYSFVNIKAVQNPNGLVFIPFYILAKNEFNIYEQCQQSVCKHPAPPVFYMIRDLAQFLSCLLSNNFINFHLPLPLNFCLMCSGSLQIYT